VVQVIELLLASIIPWLQYCQKKKKKKKQNKLFSFLVPAVEF
jgi:hypothetical protein